jgi:O-antigen/teichoic acid export membrane protein
VGWGFAAQACSSATNFALVVIGAHVLGPGGLGGLAVGLAAYFALLGFERALITNPLVAGSAAETAANRQATAQHALTLALVSLIPLAACVAALGLIVPDPFGRGLLLFAPWLLPALIQDLGRSVVFRDRNDRATAYSDATWLAALLVVAPLAFVVRSDWLVVGVWGTGACAGAFVVLTQLRWRPSRLSHAVAWWRSQAWRLGRWLGAQQLLYSVLSFAAVAALAGILGANDYGGLRAVQSILAPLTLLAPAIALPGLPLVARTLTVSPRRGLAITVQLGFLVGLATLAYVALIYQVPGALSFFFGEDFLQFRSIIIPIGVGQLIAAPAFGLSLFLMAAQRGRALFTVNTLNAASYLIFAVVLGVAFGLEGAAWAYAVSSAIGEIALLYALNRTARSLLR